MNKILKNMMCKIIVALHPFFTSLLLVLLKTKTVQRKINVLTSHR